MKGSPVRFRASALRAAVPAQQVGQREVLTTLEARLIAERALPGAWWIPCNLVSRPALAC
jgi:hypothetical protein